jgi:hypothetical protein
MQTEKVRMLVALVVSSACWSCGNPDDPQSVDPERRALFNDRIAITLISSATGGDEAPRAAGITAQRHGGSFENFYTRQNFDAFGGGGSFNGVAMTSERVAGGKPTELVRRWICPTSMRGLTGTIHMSAGSAETFYRVIGSGATCYQACGAQAPSGCWCDVGCEGYGDCCADKAAVCTSVPPPHCSCAINCGQGGLPCCQPSQCPF